MICVIPGALLLPAPNVVIEREEEYGTAVEDVEVEQAVVAALTIIIFFIFVYVFTALCSVHTGLFGELIVELSAVALLSIFNSLIQESGDIEGEFGMFVKHNF